MSQPSKESSQPPVITKATVFENEALCREHLRLTLVCSCFPTALPGQFVHLIEPVVSTETRVHEWEPARAAWRPGISADVEMTFRRAFSIAGLRRNSERVEIDLIYRVVGKATQWMSSLQGGDPVDILGPLGGGFRSAPEQQLALLVAGGVGLPPMLWWAQRLAARRVETIAFCGAATAELLPLTVNQQSPPPGKADTPLDCAVEFSRHGARTVISTDDGSLGYHGYITDALEEYLSNSPVDPQGTCVYTCGPEAMMKSAARLAERQGIECQVCMERSMACGMGTCQSCVIAVRDAASPEGWCYRLCCSEGPIFDSRIILWEI